jgi:hypothetical protein
VSYEEQDAFVDELCCHVPALTPAIRAAAYHARDDERDDYGACCASAPDPVADVLGRMAETIAPIEADRQGRLLRVLKGITGNLADAWGYRSTCRVGRREEGPQDAA